MSKVAEDLATLIANAAAAKQRGEPVSSTLDDAAALATELGSDADPDAFDTFFALLASALAERGARLPPMNELPPTVVPLLVAFEGSITYDAAGTIDLDRTAMRADVAMRKLIGTSPRKQRRDQQRANIKRNVAASVAESLRRHGLVPACDTEDE